MDRGRLWHTLPVMFAGSDLLAVGDPGATRLVYAIVVALGLIGVALVALAIWVFRQTRPEPELLAPLERMSDRAWRKQDPVQKRRALDEVRPPGAEPVSRAPDPPARDDEFEQRVPAVAHFEDLLAQFDIDPSTDDPSTDDDADDDHDANGSSDGVVDSIDETADADTADTADTAEDADDDARADDDDDADDAPAAEDEAHVER